MSVHEPARLGPSAFGPALKPIDTSRAMSLGLGVAAAPLWAAYFTAASAGVAYWWMTAWTRTEAKSFATISPFKAVAPKPAPRPILALVAPAPEPDVVQTAPVEPEAAVVEPVALEAAPIEAPLVETPVVETVLAPTAEVVEAPVAVVAEPAPARDLAPPEAVAEAIQAVVEPVVETPKAALLATTLDTPVAAASPAIGKPVPTKPAAAKPASGVRRSPKGKL
jgi:hypothetical protein